MDKNLHIFLVGFLAALAAIFVVYQVGAVRSFFTTAHLGSLSQ